MSNQMKRRDAETQRRPRRTQNRFFPLSAFTSASLRLCVAFAILVLAAPAWAVDVTPLRPLAILDHGRVKPIDTVARETVRFVTGYEHFGPIKDNSDGQQEISEGMDPLALVLDWSAHPVAWQTQPVLYVPLLDLRAKLKMSESQKWISPRAVMENTAFRAWERDVEQKRAVAEQNHETIFYDNPNEKRVEDAAVSLNEQLQLFQAATDLSLYPVLPADGAKSDNWIPLAAVLNLTGQDADVAKPITTAWADLMAAYKQNDDAAFAGAAGRFIDSIHSLVGADYAD